MDKKSLIKYALIAGGAYLAYWYITNFGPNGAVTDQSGNTIPGAVSWWASWFGGTSTAPAITAAPSQTTTQTQTAAQIAAAQAALAAAQADSNARQLGTGIYAPAPGTIAPADPNSPATAAEISTILNAISPTERPIVQAWIRNGTLTSKAAGMMIQNITACQAGMPTGTGSISQGCSFFQATNGVPEGAPPPGGVTGLGTLVPAPAVATAPDTRGYVRPNARSPWGRLPTGRYVN